jgi:hypothetical protein
MVHFLKGDGLFAVKLAEMNLKESDEYTCGKEQQSIFGNRV